MLSIVWSSYFSGLVADLQGYWTFARSSSYLSSCATKLSLGQVASHLVRRRLRLRRSG